MTQNSPAGQSQRPTHVRFWMLALVSAAVAIHYPDRGIIGFAGPFIAKEFVLSAVTMGWVYAAFSWSYVASQIPGGIPSPDCAAVCYSSHSSNRRPSA